MDKETTIRIGKRLRQGKFCPSISTKVLIHSKNTSYKKQNLLNFQHDLSF